MSVFDTLKERGYLAQVTHEEELKKALLQKDNHRIEIISAKINNYLEEQNK